VTHWGKVSHRPVCGGRAELTKCIGEWVRVCKETVGAKINDQAQEIVDYCGEQRCLSFGRQLNLGSYNHVLQDRHFIYPGSGGVVRGRYSTISPGDGLLMRG